LASSGDDTHYSFTVDSACQSKTQALRLKELSVELLDIIVLRYRSGEGYQNISAALKVPNNTMVSMIIKWKNLEPPILFLELASRPN
jgi:hypothetical protein